MKIKLANLCFTVLFLSFGVVGCTEGTSIWSTKIGESPLADLFGFNKTDDDKKKDQEQKIEPLITYKSLKDNLPPVIDDGYNYPLHKVKVGEKVLNSLVPKSDFQPEQVLNGKPLAIYEAVTNVTNPNFSGIIPGGDIEFQLPGETPFPFSDLNRNPMVTHPFTSLEAIPKAPPTEFFFDEVTARPDFFD